MMIVRRTSDRNSARTGFTMLELIVVILIILDCLGLPIGALQLFNGGYPIGTVMFGDVFPQGVPNVTHSHMSFGGVQVMWHPTGAFQILMFGLSHGLGFTVATLPIWLSLFPEARLIYIVRHGVDVASSLMVRERKLLQKRKERFESDCSLDPMVQRVCNRCR